MLTLPLYLVFFASGISGLIYQVIWVREFGHIFGNTIYSASLVVAIFMLGLGAGSYVLGVWADRRSYADRHLLVAYAWIEGAIALLGAGVTLVLPRLGAIVAGLSTYTTDAAGWHVLSTGSYVIRALMAIALLVPITVLMGGTLTVLVRYATRALPRGAGWSVALLYGANTLGAAAGAFLTDFALVPSIGLRNTQLAAVALNGAAALAALALAWRAPAALVRGEADAPVAGTPAEARSPVGWTALALACSGFAALGFEILWLRHLGILLGGFRAVFSLLLAVMLLGLGAGALVGGWLDRRFGRPGLHLIVLQAGFLVATLLGLALASAGGVASSALTITGVGQLSGTESALVQLWFNLRPMLLEVALPSFIGGCTFPLANALVQRSEAAVGRRTGTLYAANTAGAVCGSLVTGYLLLPGLGMQGSAAVLGVVVALAVGSLYRSLPERTAPGGWRVVMAGTAASVAAALAVWLALPGDYLVRRSLAAGEPGERLLTVQEGVNELLAVTEVPGRGRGLMTNGHAMSSTATLDQRYMRALAHIPLLQLDRPERVLVIGFGAGNTTHAATLHPTVTRVDVADLSRNILQHAGYFSGANKDVLGSARVSVFVNDGRMHLQMTPPATYDLITLEPPPIAHAGVGALYSREFYELAKSRLKPGGYLSQWLPAYQVPAAVSLAMVRAFIDVFPGSVLLSGMQAELILLGTAGPQVTMDPERIAHVLEARPAVRDDLAAVDLGTPRDLAATFVGSADTLARATLESAPATDDRPVQEYGVTSILTNGLTGVPASLFELTAAPAWCPRCYADGQVAPAVAGLDLYFALLQQVYTAPTASIAPSAPRTAGPRRIFGSAYLGTVVPDTAEAHNILGLAALRDGRVEDGIREFETALARDPRSANVRANLGQLRYEQAVPLMEARRYADAVPLLRTAVELSPDDAEAQNDLGVALASLGDVRGAVEHFNRAVQLAPDFVEAQRNLSAATRTLNPEP